MQLWKLQSSAIYRPFRIGTRRQSLHADLRGSAQYNVPKKIQRQRVSTSTSKSAVAGVGVRGGTVSESVSDGDELSGQLLPVTEFLDANEGQKLVGVYGLFDNSKKLQYVGYSRSMILAIQARLQRAGPQRCAHVRTMPFFNKAMATSANMAREVQHWIDESDTSPPGNASERELWECAGNGASASMASIDFHDFNVADLKSAADTSSIPRGGPGMMHSSFDAEGASQPAHDGPRIDMTVATVDLALDKVRPYLIADDGDVEVVDVAAGVVFLKLQGACGSCASSATTMRLGIENSLKAAFGEQLLEVLQVDDHQQDTRNITTVSSINARLAALKIAIQGLGGRVEVMDVKSGTCVIKYQGPEAMGKGISRAVKETFAHDISEVILVGF